MSPALIVVSIVVIIAIVYVVHHVRGLFKGTASCCGDGSGGCAGCSSCHTLLKEKKSDASTLPQHKNKHT
ncbi:MAG: FeoB-associated Cys-rich membrane protein [Megasphaera sp.]|jgi:hypothetical protein|nr:FeoB-associated Cys-rich membrane protein [Megasphaera sp.]